MSAMHIGDRAIHLKTQPFIIAEISANHNGSFDRALELIEAAASNGADAVKFQVYTADSITLNCDDDDFIIRGGPWDGNSLYELYKTAATPHEWFPDLFAYARQEGVIPFASVFSPAEVDMLERLDCPAYKIASFELVDIPLIGYAASTGKPLILSTGMANDAEITDALAVFNGLHNDVALLHCISGYPTALSDSRLADIHRLQRFINCTIGISDHTLGHAAPVAAVMLGATIIEKHLTLKRADGGPDAAFSLEPAEFYEMVQAVRGVWSAYHQPKASAAEDSSRPLRRSLYAVADIAAGEPLTSQNMRSIRPGYGLPPKLWPQLFGRRAKTSIKRGTPLSLDLLD